MRDENVFLTLWTLAVAAATAAFVLHLGLRVRSIELGYELGRAHARVERLREVRHVLEVELGSQRTPERVDFVARTLLGMAEPSPDRIRSAGTRPRQEPKERGTQLAASVKPNDSRATADVSDEQGNE
jgi:cell division protein FtsL